MRPSLNRWARIAALLGLLVPLLALSAVPGPGATALAAGSIGGVVYQDFNADGVRNLISTPALPAIDRPIAGVTVTATCVTARGADGVLGTSDDTLTSYPAVVSDASGAYSIGLAALPPITPTPAEQAAGQRACRIEFSTLPTGFQPGAIGTDDGSAVQFVNDGDTASFGVNRPADYCQNNPTLYTTCFATENPVTGPNSARAVLIDFPYNAGAPSTTTTAAPYDVPTSHTTAIPANQIGATYGIAVRRSTGEVYTSAYLKHGAGFGPGGPAAIYQLTGANTAAVFVDLSTTFGPDAAGADPHTAYAPDTAAAFDYDAGAIPFVGTRAFGDLDLLEDLNNPANDALFTVNLFDRELYRIALDGSKAITRFPIPTNIPNGLGAPCAAADVRPFGLGTHNGLVYLGLVCSAQSTGADNEINGSIITFDPATSTFSAAPVLNVPLVYPRGNAYAPDPAAAAIKYPAQWRSWVNNVDYATWMLDPRDGATIRPQPMISDIVFDGNDLLIGIRDRGPDMYAGEAAATFAGRSVFPFGVTAGDLLRACGTTGTSWTLESNGSCPSGGITTAGANNGQGVGGGEFYFQEDAPRPARFGGTIHDQMALGAMAQVPGYPNVASTTTDPIRIPDQLDDAGISWYSNTAGTQQRAYRVYDSNGPAGGGTFGKAGGLGDLEVLCDKAPIEVGNRVWIDSNGNGQQDAGEPPVAGVTVQMYTASGTRLGTAVTDASGSYRFSSNGGTSTASARYGVGIGPNGDYSIRLDNPADYAPGGPLAGYAPTQANVGGASIDSNGVLTVNPAGSPAGRFPTTDVRTGAAGANNHTYDFGFSTTYSLGNQVWFDADNSGTINGAEVGAAGVSVSLFADVNGDGVPDSATPLSTVTTDSGGYYRFDGLAAGNYVVRINPSNFAAGGPLAGYVNSTPTETNPNANGDNNDNGLPTSTALTNGVFSGSLKVGPGLQPLGEKEPVTYGPGSTDGVAAPDDRSNLTVDFGFYRLQLGNQLWYDANNNGVYEPGTEQPLPAGVTVELRDSATGALVASTTTDANGQYNLTGFPEGRYYVNIPAGQSATSGYRASDTVISGVDSRNNGTTTPAGAIRSGDFDARAGLTTNGNSTDVPTATTVNPTLDFGIYRLRLGNQLWYDTNNDGTFNPASETTFPAGVTVELRDATTGAVVATVQTDATGKYLFDGLAPGNYYVNIPGNQPAVAGYQASSSATSGVDNRNNGTKTGTDFRSGNFNLQPSVNGPTTSDGPASYNNPTLDFGFYQLSLGNQLWYDNNNDGFYQPGTDTALPAGVKLELRDSVTGALIAETTTNALGQYLFSGLQPGSYYVNIPGGQAALKDYKPGIVPGGVIDNKNNGTQAGQNVRSGDFVLVPGSTDLGQTVNGPRGATDQPTADFGFVRGPTAVTLASLTASRSGDAVIIRWVTTRELNTLGFRILRSTTGSLADAVEVTGVLIQSQGEQGGSYSWTDREAATGTVYSYWLVEQETSGVTSTFGPVRVGGAAGVGRTVYVPLIGR